LSGVDPPRSGAGRFGARPTRPGIAPPWEALWRVAVAEESMAPALFHGDWLLLDPTVRRWPRRGSVVVFREPGTALLAVKRVAGGPRDRIRIAAGMLHLGPGQAWLLGDNAVASIDSRRYGPVEVESLVARAWFRYAPAGRVGPIPRRRA
jgi:signal peptidase I